jgi:hypothetical protein
MRLRLRFLRRTELIQESLRADGWQLVRQRDNQVTAEHPLVKDEASARIRLQDLGLLTSAALYIEFIRSKTADPITQIITFRPTSLPHRIEGRASRSR